MNKASDQALTALKLLFASDLADPLHDEIESIYQAELESAKGRTISQAKSMIAAQLEKLPIQTFGINLDDVDLESLAHGFLPLGVTFN
jgi:hypothetical protein